MDLTNAQNLVVNTNNKSLLVSASAGSGKTFVVIERIIEGIKNGKDVSRLLILTFTNAAAAELKQRLMDRLYSLKEEYISNGDKKNVLRISKQISKVPMADVSTIHSFCLSIIRNNFYNLGVDPNVTTLDATKATILLTQTINDVIEEEYDKGSEEFLDILDILGTETNLIEVVHSLYISYKSIIESDMWIDSVYTTYGIEEGKDLAETKFGLILLQNIKDRLKILKIELEQLIEKLGTDSEFETRKEMLKGILNKISIAINYDTYDELYNYLDELENIPRLPSNKVSDEELKEQVKAIKITVTDEIKQIRNIAYKDSRGIIQELNDTLKYAKWYVDVLTKIDEKYMECKREKNAIDFADYEHLAMKALEDEAVVNKYKEKYQEIYIDEYQDTSYAQEAIINKIAKIDNVVMVGDVKQSIYGFRNAKPDLFTNKYEELPEITSNNDEYKQGKIILAQNFRSRKEIIDSTNDVFGALMSKNFGGTRYEEKEALVFGAGYEDVIEEESSIYKTELNIIEKDSTDEEFVDNEEKAELLEDIENIKLEALAVSRRIKELTNGSFKVFDLKNKEYRKCEYKDIVILLRSVEGKAKIVSDVLTQNEIPNYADSKSGFYKSEEINLIISFLKVLDNPYDDIALASVLYSIIGQFTLDDLAIIRVNNTSSPLITTLKECKINDNEINSKITNFLELLDKFKNYLKSYTIAETIIRLYNETGIYLSLRMDKLGEVKCANLDNFVQIVSDFEKSETIGGLYNLIKYLDVLKSKESAGDSPKIIAENEYVVRIMTIHKSKGLEFPVVILMNTAAKYNEQDTKEKVQFDDTLGLGLDIYNKQLGLTYPSIIKQSIKTKNKKQLRSEALRLLYVAFTRAKEKLIIYGTVPTLDKYMKKIIVSNESKVSDIIAFNNNSHLKCILQAIINKDKNFNVMIHKKEDYITKVKDSKSTLNRNMSKIEQLKKLVKKYEIKEDLKQVEELKGKFIDLEQIGQDINRKYTVSELKGEQELCLSELKPQVLENEISPTGYGTLVHSIIQHLQYNNISYDTILKVAQEQIRIFALEGKVNEKYVTKNVLDMCSNINCYINGAKVIKNELEFVIKDRLEELENISFKEETLVQGVIDMYIHTAKDKHIIIDFKTDKVETDAELIDRYVFQLKIYKRAIELAYNIKIDGAYIYSFSLNRLIEVE